MKIKFRVHGTEEQPMSTDYKVGDIVTVSIPKPTWKDTGYNPFKFFRMWNHSRQFTGTYTAVNEMQRLPFSEVPNHSCFAYRGRRYFKQNDEFVTLMERPFPIDAKVVVVPGKMEVPQTTLQNEQV